MRARVAAVRPGTVIPFAEAGRRPGSTPWPSPPTAAAWPSWRGCPRGPGRAPSRMPASPASASSTGNTFRVRSSVASSRPFRARRLRLRRQDLRRGRGQSSRRRTPEARSASVLRDGPESSDAETGMPIRGFRHADDINAVAFSPDGQILVTGSEDGHITALEVASGRSLGSGVPNARLGGANHPVVGVVIAPDGRTLFTWTRGGSAGLWTLSPQPGPPARLRIPDPQQPRRLRRLLPRRRIPRHRLRRRDGRPPRGPDRQGEDLPSRNRAVPGRSRPWAIRPTAGSSPPPGRSAPSRRPGASPSRSSSATRRAARSSPTSSARPGSPPSPSRPTARPWPPRAPTGWSGSGTSWPSPPTPARADRCRPTATRSRSRTCRSGPAHPSPTPDSPHPAPPPPTALSPDCDRDPLPLPTPAR